MSKPPTSPVPRFWAKVREAAPDECWEWQGARDTYGYGCFGIRHGYNIRAHVFSYEIAHGREVPKGIEILHSCDNPPCINPAHLFEGTQKDNMADSAAKGRKRGHGGPPGERCARSKLTERQVVEMRQRYANGEPEAALAAAFAVHQTTVNRVVKYRTWASGGVDA